MSLDHLKTFRSTGFNVNKPNGEVWNRVWSWSNGSDPEQDRVTASVFIWSQTFELGPDCWSSGLTLDFSSFQVFVSVTITQQKVDRRCWDTMSHFTQTSRDELRLIVNESKFSQSTKTHFTCSAAFWNWPWNRWLVNSVLDQSVHTDLSWSRSLVSVLFLI